MKLTTTKIFTRKKCLCDGGPFDKKVIMLSDPSSGTAPFLGGFYMGATNRNATFGSGTIPKIKWMGINSNGR